MAVVSEATDIPTQIAEILGISVEYVFFIIALILLWKLIWYGLAIYKTIEKKQKAWFVILFVSTILLSDFGLLAIVYLIMHRDNKGKKPKKQRRK